jgi:hypothetical protein
MKKLRILFLLSLIPFLGYSQNTEKESNPYPAAQNRITVNLGRFGSPLSITFERAYPLKDSSNWQLGFGIGLGMQVVQQFDNNFIPDDLPMYGFIEYGQKHQVGLSVGYNYNFVFTQTPLFRGPDGQIPTVFYDYNGVQAQLYYRYHFDKKNKYFGGLGYQFYTEFGEVLLDQKIRPELEMLPTFTLGFKF